MKIVDGWLQSAQRIFSPNCNERPAGIEIDLLVVHGISLPPGEFGGPYIHDLFTNRLDPSRHPYFAEISGLKVSSHLLIHRDGDIVQYAPFQKRAWHAGVSCFEDRCACNDFSIGVELEGCDNVPYTNVQYRKLAMAAHALRNAWPAITPSRIVGHCDIAPGRKTDPGPAFDWRYFRKLLNIMRQNRVL